MRIFRVEHATVLRDGRPAGPYNSTPFCCSDEYDGISAYIEELCWKKTGTIRPTPENDGMGYVLSDDHIFGFKTAGMLHDWFYGDLRPLHRFGFVVSQYEVAKSYTTHGNRQSTFQYSAAKRLLQSSLLSVYKLRSEK